MVQSPSRNVVENRVEKKRDIFRTLGAKSVYEYAGTSTLGARGEVSPLPGFQTPSGRVGLGLRWFPTRGKDWLDCKKPWFYLGFERIFEILGVA